ncbi:TetR/AcrR family transcriptional regulator C-terminal domain-containing protein [Nocardia sp. 2]|uniref:TetR/AcrR family transcriptional regulator C-terminal domain-containing protein n=1 Tax=Nocardia acididurans TaxID=2802282 RepID=A0ABS1MH70_9NOCA|nr:TetR/AcrR family transcriptional regulator [Nocardia acididurans]MBL1080015.1 TetR/AcrR family transcriptional regulator C-terminal domain-containing protein [Nocardia acididurans]
MTDHTMPDHLARLWRLPLGSHLGRRAALDVDRIVGTAVELADRDGLSGATLPKIAAALDVTPMSLYRHIGSKDELTDLMVDAATGPPPEALGDDRKGVPELDAAASSVKSTAGEPLWRSALGFWARTQLTAHRRHPWLIQLPVSGPPRGPNALAWMDAGLRALRDTQLDWPAKIGVITLVGGYVRQAFTLERQLEQAWAAAHLDEAGALRAYTADLSALVTPDRFPDAAALFASGIFTSPEIAAAPPDADFHYGLSLILDGVAAAIAAQ